MLFFIFISLVEASMRILTLSALCILLFSSSIAWADFYRYVGKEGKEFFTNDLKQIPQEYRSSAKVVKPDESPVSVGEEPAARANRWQRSGRTSTGGARNTGTRRPPISA